jgi:TonB-dependent starch-binding outer membrane protein SusC
MLYFAKLYFSNYIFIFIISNLTNHLFIMNQSTFTRFLAFTMVWCMTALSAFGQGRISGKIIDEKKEPVMGATVIVVGTTLGAATDMDGNYTIEDVAAGEAKLQASYIGYETKEMTVKVVKNQTATADMQLGENKELLESVVITGYGQTQQKRDVTGAISKVDGKTIQGQVVQSFDQALQGAASGVQITQGSGMAGSASMVRIRGASTVSAAGDPLYVIDGIPIVTDYFLTGGTRGNQNYNPLSSLNPNDIESIEVLKDASAAAIYGSRGANGVIIITTKRGKNKDNKPQFNFSTRMGWGEPTKQVSFLDNKQLLNVWQKAWEMDGNTGRVPLPATYTSQGFTYADAENTNTNWQDLMVRKGFKQEYNLSMSSMSKNGKFGSYIGTSYNNNNSYIIGNNQERASVRANFDIRPMKNMTIALSSSLTRNLINRDGTDDFWGGWIGTQAYYLPIYPIYDKKGDYYNFYKNPIAQRENNKLQNLEWRTINTANLNYAITPELSINGSASYEFIQNSDHKFVTGKWRTFSNPNATGAAAQSYTSEWQTKSNNLNLFGTAVYDFKKILPSKHKMTLMVGAERQARQKGRTQFQFVGLKSWTYAADLRDTLNGTAAAAKPIVATGASVDTTLFLSGFSRLNYSYNEKYQVQLTYRRDGSNVFGANKRFGNFPSVGLGWVISEEKFFKKMTPVVNFLKLRASWGQTGNAGLNWAQQYGGYTVNGYSYNNTSAAGSYKNSNPNLQWENKETVDAGIQFGFLKDRIVLDLAAYRSLTSNAFMKVTDPQSSGITGDDNNSYFNIGVVRNQGLELSITSRNIVSKGNGFRWTTTFNATTNDHQLVSAGGYLPDALPSFFGDLRPVTGYYIATHYKVKMLGIDPATGKPIYGTASGAPTSQYDPANNRVPLGGVLPYLQGGLLNRFEYKGFDLTANIVYSLGGFVYDDAAKRQRWIMSNDGDGYWNMRSDALENRWNAPGDANATWPRLTWKPESLGMLEGSNGYWQNNTSAFLEKADYARLRNVTFGYTFTPKNVKGLNSMRLYFVGSNLYTFTSYTGWDPEVARETSSDAGRNVGGANNTFLTAPQERSYIFGLDVSF